jgi:Fe2+ or Zn2+ uptake regulation protein
MRRTEQKPVSAPGTDEVARRVERFCAAARRSGLRVTRQRREIFTYLASSVDHPDVEAVFVAVRQTLPDISLDTVYRTLRMLCDEALVTEVSSRSETMRFDPNIDPHHHHICIRCGRIADFTDARLDDRSLGRAARALGSVIAVQVVAKGECRDCAQTVATRSGSSSGRPGLPQGRKVKK